jgi:hypothetical protein
VVHNKAASSNDQWNAMRIETWTKARSWRLHASLQEALHGFAWETRPAKALEMYRSAPVVTVLEFCTRNPDAAGTVVLDADERPPLPIEFCAAFGCQTVMLFPGDRRWIIRGGDEDWDVVAFGIPSSAQE